MAVEERADLFRRVGRRPPARTAAKERFERDAQEASRCARILRSVATGLENRPSAAR